MPTENRSSNTEQMVSVPRELTSEMLNGVCMHPDLARSLWEALLKNAPKPADQHQGKPVLIQAVAVTREDDDEGLCLEWLLEGGISEMEFPGMVLFALPDANDLCEEDGSAEVYLHPPAVDGFSAEQMTAQGADGYRNGIKAAAELAADYPELAKAIRALPLPQ